jgi:DNA-binding transcriptional LysR family regulator
MNIDRIDLNLFKVFLVIYDLRNLTRAAESLNVTQPAISNTLARLREAFNDPLFERTPEGMLPTVLADQIVDDVRASVDVLQRSVSSRREFDPARSHRMFRMSMSDLGETLLMPAVLDRAGKLAPDISWQSAYIPRRELPTSLARGDIDLAIDAPLMVDAQLNHVPLLSDRYVCALRPGHPAARGELGLEEYLSLCHIHISSRRKGVGIVDGALRRQGLQRRIVMWTPHYLAAPLHVLQTDLALTLPFRAASQFDLEIRELPLSVPRLDLHLYWHRKQESDPAHRWLRLFLNDMREDLGFAGA